MDSDLVLDAVELVAAEDMVLGIAGAGCTVEEESVDPADMEEPSQSFDVEERFDVGEFPHEEVGEFEVVMVHVALYFQVWGEEHCVLAIQHEDVLPSVVMRFARACSCPFPCHHLQQDLLVCD